MLQTFSLLPTEQKCKHYGLTKEDIVRTFYSTDYTVDYAIPLQWVLAMCEEYKLEREDFAMIAWGYPKDKESPWRNNGHPIPLTIKAAELVYKINSAAYFAMTEKD